MVCFVSIIRETRPLQSLATGYNHAGEPALSPLSSRKGFLDHEVALFYCFVFKSLVSVIDKQEKFKVTFRVTEILRIFKNLANI